jgi:hypothetical protein
MMRLASGSAMRSAFQRSISAARADSRVSDCVMLFEPFARDGLFGHARCGGADLVLRLQFDALGFQGSVIDPGVDIEFGEPLVHVLGPGFAPVRKQLGFVPLADFGAEARLSIVADFHLAHAQHDMRVRLGFAVRPNIPMDIEIGDHAAIDKLALDKVAGQLDAIRLDHLAGNGELDLTGQLCVLAQFRRLDIVPQLLAVFPLLGRAVRQHDSLCTTPLLLEKSWCRSSRSSRSREAERYAAEATAEDPAAREITLAEKW